MRVGFQSPAPLLDQSVRLRGPLQRLRRPSGRKRGVHPVTEKGLFLDLRRMLDESMTRASLGASWQADYVFSCDLNHRLHFVADVLEALGYVERRRSLEPLNSQRSMWSFTQEGVELYEDLARSNAAHRRR